MFKNLSTTFIDINSIYIYIQWESMTLSHVPIATSVYLLKFCEFTALLPELIRDSGSFKRAARFRFAIYDLDAPCMVYLLIFTYICNKNQPNVARYTIHGPYGLYLIKYIITQLYYDY